MGVPGKIPHFKGGVLGALAKAIAANRKAIDESHSESDDIPLTHGGSGELVIGAVEDSAANGGGGGGGGATILGGEFDVVTGISLYNVSYNGDSLTINFKVHKSKITITSSGGVQNTPLTDVDLPVELEGDVCESE